MYQDSNPATILIGAIMTAIKDVSCVVPNAHDEGHIDFSLAVDALMSVLAMAVEADPSLHYSEGRCVGANLGKAIGQRIDAARTLYSLTGQHAWEGSAATLQ